MRKKIKLCLKNSFAKTDNCDKINNIIMEKAAIRKVLLEKLKAQKEEIRLKKSKLIKNKLFKLKYFKEAKNIMFYLALKGEVETKEMITESLKAGKSVYVPVCNTKCKSMIPSKITSLSPRGFRLGPYGINHPSVIKRGMLKKIDLVIAPAVGFDKSLNRLGRGKGYYDSFFKKLSVHTKKIGLAFRFQILNNLPTSSFDQPVDKIIFA